MGIDDLPASLDQHQVWLWLAGGDRQFASSLRKGGGEEVVTNVISKACRHLLTDLS